MDVKYKTFSLSEIGIIITGKTPPSKLGDTFNGDMPFLTPSDLNGRKWCTDTERKLNAMGQTKLKTSIIPARSVCVSCIGSDLGKVTLANTSIVTNQQINSIIVDETYHNAEYIFYLFTTMQSKLKSIASGSATPIISKSLFSKILIKLPSRNYQNFVVKQLSSLDDKIELNRQINQTLEAMAQAIFKSWFIDFDPVKAKIKAIKAGKDPLRAAMGAISGKTDAQLDQLPRDQYDKLAHTASLFPDKLVPSPLGDIPEGWESGKITDIAEITIGGDWGKDKQDNSDYIQAVSFRGVDLEHLRSKGLAKNAPLRWIKKSSLEKRIIQDTDVLIGGSGAGPCGRPLYFSHQIRSLYKYPITYSNFVKRLRCKNKNTAIYLDEILWQMFLKNEIKNYINGTSVPNLNDKGLLSHPILIPSESLINNYSQIVDLFHRRLYSFQNEQLLEIKDALMTQFFEL